MKFAFDLDGVLRHLTSIPFKGEMAQTWNQLMPNGQTLEEYFKDNPHHILYAEPTEYLSVAPKELLIITHQHPDWIPYTEKWLRSYLPSARVIYVSDKQEKIDFLNKDKDYLLVEDYPFYKDNSRLVIIDRPYNQNVKDCFCRVKLPKELKFLLDAEI